MPERTVEEIFEDVTGRLEGLETHGEYAKAYCPVHPNTDTPALSVIKKDDGVTFKCHGADCPRSEICTAIGIKEKDLYVENGRGVLVVMPGGKNEATLEAYSEKVGIPAERLKEWGLEEAKRNGKVFLKIPYYDEHGVEQTVRRRHALEKSPEGADRRFSWPRGAKLIPYGLEQLDRIKEDGYVFLVEGESDQQTLRYHDIRSLGIPGSNNWKDEWADYLEGVERIYAVIEPDQGGDAFEKKLADSPLCGRIRLVDLGGDVNDVHKSDHVPDFEAALKAAAAEATPLYQKESSASQEAVQGLWEACEGLALKEDILAEFEEDYKALGVVGQEREGKILYLASTTRYLDNPSSIIIKGPSSAGKSYMLDKALEFQPDEGFYLLSAMGDKALAYFDEPLKHRHLVIAEAAALENSEMAQYFIRELLSRGNLRYVVTVSTDNGPENRVIDVEGPTGLFMTTTAQNLNLENETRYFSIGVNDTRAQTAAVMKNIARRKKRRQRGGPDMKRWHALQKWIALAGNKSVDIPYAEWLSDQIPPIAVRLRRDFEQIHNLIEAHAILHQKNRETNEWGDIVATREDYAVVRSLLADLVSENLEAAVPEIVRETVEKAKELHGDLDDKDDGVSLKEIADALKLDKGTTSRRVQSALRRGFLKNLEAGRKGVKAQYVPDDSLPEDIVILPTAEEIPEECCSVASVGTFQVLQHTTISKVKKCSDENDTSATPATVQHPQNEQNPVNVVQRNAEKPATPATLQHSKDTSATDATLQHSKDTSATPATPQQSEDEFDYEAMVEDRMKGLDKLFEEEGRSGI